MAKCRLIKLIFLSIMFYSSVLKAGTIDHIEPRMWWVGMHNPKLQVMVHGENISSYKLSLNYPGVTLEGSHTLDNPNYLFLDLNISSEALPGELSLEFTRNGHKTFIHNYPLLARVKHSAQRQGFSAKDVIYLLTPDRFANGDPSNDMVNGMHEQPNRPSKGGRHGGDIAGIIQHLDYLADMGYTQLWLNPVLENNQENYSYHGYSTTDYYKVDPRFGTNDLYKDLSVQAKSKGIGLIMDMILNHIGSEHWWMKDLPSKHWINHEGQFSPTTHSRESLHDPHSVPEDVAGFADGWFVPSMPDLNQSQAEVAQYLIQNAIWWVEYAGLSGIRVDTYSYSDKEFLGAWSNALMNEYPNINIVGEEWTTNPAIVAYWQKGSLRYDDYDSALPSVFDFPLQQALTSALTEAETWGTGLKKLYQVLASDFLYGSPENLVVFADNHDMSRISTQLNDDISLYKIAMTYVLTTRGIPQIFYGTEIMMTHPGSDDHGLIRSDFPGGWQGDQSSAFIGNGLRAVQMQAQAFLKKLLNWRKTSDAVTKGELTHYAPNDGVYVYFRHTEHDRVMVVVNKNEKMTSLDTPRFARMLEGMNVATDVLEGSSQKLSDGLSLPPKSATIFQLQP